MSEMEKTFVVHGIQDNFRVDGRGCEDYRHMEVETNVVSNAAGSSRLRLANTDVLVGVKVEIGDPQIDSPSCGRLEFFLDCSANAAPEFEGRGGEELATALCTTLSRAYCHAGCMDLSDLCIISRDKCWILYIDILLLECGGNLFDAVALAVKAALFNTRIPNLRVSPCEQGNEIEVSDDPYDFRRINVIHTPCLVTVNKIGHCHVVDASMEEETCTLSKLVMGVLDDGRVTVLSKDEGFGSLNPESIFEMMESGQKVGQELNASLMAALLKEDKDPVQECRSFLR